MTREEFLNKVPEAIDHDFLGDSKLTILQDTKLQKGACYTNKNKFKTCVRYGSSWGDLYKWMAIYLAKNGFIE